MDVISEIIAYEKHAEEIVAQANKKAEAILSDAAALREKERIVCEEERSDKINSYHDELKRAEKNIALRLQPSAALSLSVLTMNSRRTGINGQTRYIKISFRLNDSIA